MKYTWLRSLALAVGCSLLAAPAYGQARVEVQRPAAAKEVRARGRIVRLQAPDRFVMRTADNKEVILYGQPTTRYLINGRVVKYGDLRVGSDVNVVYVPQGERFLVNTVTVGEPVPGGAVEVPAKETVLEGQVVRVVGEDQVILRTSAGKEVVVYVAPQTTYTFEGRPGRFVDLRPGADIRVTYDVRERRNMARAIVGRPRLKR